MNLSYNNFRLENISDDKIKILITNRIIRMTVDSIPFIREHYPQHIEQYILKNTHKYLELITADLFKIDEALIFIKSTQKDFSDEDKIKLLSFTNDKISVAKNEYSDVVTTYILENNRDDSDLPEVLSTYEKWGKSTRTVLYKLAEQRAKNLQTLPKNISDTLLSELLISDVVPRGNKIELFIAELRNMNKEQYEIHLDELGLLELKKIFGGGRPKFSVNDENKQVLEAFKGVGIIFNYQIDDDSPEKFVIQRKEPQKLAGTDKVEQNVR